MGIGSSNGAVKDVPMIEIELKLGGGRQTQFPVQITGLVSLG